MRVIFLDLDGVLNSSDWVDSFLSHGRPIPRPPLDREAVRRLDTIADTTGAVIVLSTSWRGEARLPQWLVEHGCRAAVVGKTPNLWPSERGVEIAWWLHDQASRGVAVEGFCILDDGGDMADLSPHLIQTTPEHGLQDEHVERAVAMLTRSLSAHAVSR